MAKQAHRRIGNGAIVVWQCGLEALCYWPGNFQPWIVWSVSSQGPALKADNGSYHSQFSFALAEFKRRSNEHFSSAKITNDVLDTLARLALGPKMTKH